MKPRWFVTRTALAVLLAVWSIRPAAGQERPPAAAELAAGALLFPDEGTVTEGFVGGTVRFYVWPRVSVGPEIAAIRGMNHSHLMLTGNVSADLAGPLNGKPRPVVPFVVAGGGLFRSVGSTPGNRRRTFNNGAFTAGGGVRALVGKRAFVGAEARIGWEMHIRLNAIVGFQLGR